MRIIFLIFVYVIEKNLRILRTDILGFAMLLSPPPAGITTPPRSIGIIWTRGGFQASAHIEGASRMAGGGEIRSRRSASASR